MIPIVLPGMIAVALFGFTLSYDEFPRSWLTVGSKNTLPLEIWTMTTNVTSPALYALGRHDDVRFVRRHSASRSPQSLSSNADDQAGHELPLILRPAASQAFRRDPTGQPHQDLRRLDRCRQHQSHHTAWLLLLPLGAVGLRQDDDSAHDRRPRNADLGRDLYRQGDGGRQAAGRARNGHDVPELCPVPASDRPRQRRLLSEDAQRRQGRAPSAGGGDVAIACSCTRSRIACPRSSRAGSNSASRSPVR